MSGDKGVGGTTMDLKNMQIDELFAQYDDQNSEQNEEKVYVAYKRIADYTTCDCLKCCCCIECCG